MKKLRQSKVVRVELRAGGGLHEPEKPGWSAGDMAKQPGNEMNNNNKMKIKNEMKNTNGKMKIQQKPPRRFSQAKYHLWEFLTLKNYDYSESNSVLALPLLHSVISSLCF